MKTQKQEVRVVNSKPVEKRAKGVRVAPGSLLRVAKNPGDELPTNLRPIFAKIAKHRSGVKVESLVPRGSTGCVGYQRFLIRNLVALAVVKAIPQAR